MTTCERCGQTIELGMWAFCPHGPVRDVAVKSDTLNQWFENLGPEPVFCATQADLDREMRERNLEPRDKYQPGDKYLTNSQAYIDAQTLENAKALADRAFGAERKGAACETFRAEWRTPTL